MTSFEIREFCFAKDYPAVIRLWEESGPGIHIGRSDGPAEIEKKLQRDPDLFLLAESDGEIVGAVIGGFDGRRGLVYHLAVAIRCRGRGIANALMAELEQRLKEKGCLKVYLLVVEDNDLAIRYYEGHGWERMTGLLPYAKNLEP